MKNSTFLSFLTVFFNFFERYKNKKWNITALDKKINFYLSGQTYSVKVQKAASLDLKWY